MRFIPLEVQAWISFGMLCLVFSLFWAVISELAGLARILWSLYRQGRRAA